MGKKVGTGMTAKVSLPVAATSLKTSAECVCANCTMSTSSCFDARYHSDSSGDSSDVYSNAFGPG